MNSMDSFINQRRGSMDHFVYNRKGSYSFEGDNWTHQIFVFTCPECTARLWGIWDFKTGRSKQVGWLATRDTDLCFREGFQTMMQKRGQEIPTEEHAKYRQIDKYRQEALKFIELEECPLCGARLTKADLRYWGHDTSDIERSWNVRPRDAMKHLRGEDADSLVQSYNWAEEAELRKNGRYKYNDFIKQCANVSVPSKKITLQNTEQLISFLKCLVNVEKNIYTVSERLEDLYEHVYILAMYARHSEQRCLGEKRKEIAEFQAELKRRQEAPLPTGGLPKKPVAPKAPEEPILKKPGLFNKKRVMEQNAVLKIQYENACVQHTEAMKKYDTDLIRFNEAVKRLEAEHKMQQSKMCQTIEKKCQVAQQEYRQLSTSKISTEEVLFYETVTKEISEAKELLMKLYKTRKQMYEGGIIFGKYHDFVAISSFYEYLSSGRCTSLDGTQGAYNLYENEIRMDAIITQLGTVVECLEEIQKNQYVIYSAIKEATNEIKTLNNTMGKIEQNTRITAFYTKKNAELTDTLCFLTALN